MGYGQNISVNFPNITVERALEILRNQEGYSFSVKTNEKNKKKTKKETKQIGSSAESKKISGRVTDKQGEPLIGVSIIAKGANKGTITNIDGYYSLTVPDKSVIQFS